MLLKLTQLPRYSDLSNRPEVNKSGSLVICYSFTATGILTALEAVLAYTQVDKRQCLFVGMSTAQLRSDIIARYAMTNTKAWPIPIHFTVG